MANNSSWIGFVNPTLLHSGKVLNVFPQPAQRFLFFESITEIEWTPASAALVNHDNNPLFPTGAFSKFTRMRSKDPLEATPLSGAPSAKLSG
jgi:hypothetical protein